MHYQAYKRILSPSGGMNIYRGCNHGCIYCDSRSACYGMLHDFEDIEVKTDAPTMLREELKAKRKKGMIGTGAMSDPYIPLEAELGYTRKCLQEIAEQGFGLAIQTKSDLILRDIDLLKEINSNARCIVQITLTTYEEALCKLIEPAVCGTGRRVEVLQILRDNHIPTVVWLCPLLPFINDTEANLKGILGYCRETGVKGILNFGIGMTLRQGNREYFYAKLDEHFPGLRERYVNSFGNSYVINSPHHKSLMRIFHAFCDEAGIMQGENKIFSYLRNWQPDNEQLEIF